MAFARTLARALGLAEVDAGDAPSTVLHSTPASWQTSIPTHADWLTWASWVTPVNLETALALPGVMRANVLITDLASQVDLYEERRIVDDSGNVRWVRIADPSPLVRQPNPDQPRDETIAELVAGIAGHGEAALVLAGHDPQDHPTVGQVIPVGELDMRWAPNGLDREVKWRGRTLRLGRDLAYLGHYRPPGRVRAVGPIQVYARQLVGWGAAEEWAHTFFETGATSPTIVSVPGSGDDSDAAAIKAQLIEARGGVQEPAVMFGGATIANPQIRPDQAQALDTRRWHVQMAANMYGLNPYMLAVAMSGANITYQTLPDLFAEAIRLTIYPSYLRKIETAITHVLPRGRRARFDLSEFLRADEQTRMATAAVAINAGVHTVEEWRAREGLGPKKQERTPA